MSELSNSFEKIKLIVMGCMSSKRDINDIHPNIFSVLNVDDDGVRHSQGQLEVTDANLVLYQKGKEPVRWPLKCLRRYGYETNMFSFESGRRCKTGAGIYAFRCQRAEQLFNLLQTRVRNYHQSLNSNIVLRGSSRQLLDRNAESPSHNNAGSTTNTNTNSTTIPPLPPLRRGSSSSTDELSGPVYVNWKNGNPSVAYENPLNFAIPKNNVVIHNQYENEREYANIKKNRPEEEPRVNYIVLDLNQSGSSSDLTHSDHPPPPSCLTVANQQPSTTTTTQEVIPEGYATIDFDKTVALTKSANADPIEEPGVRKTRHNSTLSSSITQNMNLGIG